VTHAGIKSYAMLYVYLGKIDRIRFMECGALGCIKLPAK
jgi:hypothetical protein